jgi:CheY-like chemotaxis protein
MARRVLVVEDHAESAEALIELLGMWGYEAHTAEDGESALDVLQSLRPDVVIADIGLPGIDGHELARRVRRTPGHDGTLLIALTGYGGRASDFAASGFDHHLVKPVDLNNLERLLAGGGWTRDAHAEVDTTRRGGDEPHHSAGARPQSRGDDSRREADDQ